MKKLLVNLSNLSLRTQHFPKNYLANMPCHVFLTGFLQVFGQRSRIFSKVATSGLKCWSWGGNSYCTVLPNFMWGHKKIALICLYNFKVQNNTLWPNQRSAWDPGNLSFYMVSCEPPSHFTWFLGSLLSKKIFFSHHGHDRVWITWEKNKLLNGMGCPSSIIKCQGWHGPLQ